VRVETDDGLVGWGESIVPKRADAVEGAVRDLARNIIGSDPSRIEDLWQRMHRGGFFRGGPVLATAIAGIEQALWDIKGKRYGLPVYEFLGGRVRERVRAYAWVGGDRPESVVAEVRERVAQGFTAIKMNATAEMHYVDSFAKVEGVIARVAAIRDAFGNNVDVALDFHGRVHRAMAALLIRELAPLHPLWVEEPVLEEHNDLLPKLAGLGVPIATGERLYNRWDFKPVLEARAVDVIQPDVSLTGIFELEKISRMAEAYDVAVAPHCPNGPISLAATLQLDACLPNVFIQEQSTGIHYHAGYAGLQPREMDAYLLDTSELAITDGYLTLPTGPGLGIAVDEQKVRADQQDWHLPDPVWRNADGTLSEW
jgi:galactonate dehydratase